MRKCYICDSRQEVAKHGKVSICDTCLRVWALKLAPEVVEVASPPSRAKTWVEWDLTADAAALAAAAEASALLDIPTHCPHGISLMVHCWNCGSTP